MAWHKESRRHSLASKGIKTANKMPNSLKLMKKEDTDRKSLTVMERDIYNRSRALGYDHETAMMEVNDYRVERKEIADEFVEDAIKEKREFKGLSKGEKKIYNQARAGGDSHQDAMDEIENVKMRAYEEVQEITLWETDDELKEQSGGDNWFVTYAQGSKINTFKRKKDAEKFQKARIKEVNKSYGL